MFTLAVIKELSSGRTVYVRTVGTYPTFADADRAMRAEPRLGTFYRHRITGGAR